MTRTLIDLDDAALDEVRAILGTTTKVETVNRALRETVRLHRLAEQFDRPDNPFADAPMGDAAWT